MRRMLNRIQTKSEFPIVDEVDARIAHMFESDEDVVITLDQNPQIITYSPSRVNARQLSKSLRTHLAPSELMELSVALKPNGNKAKAQCDVRSSYRDDRLNNDTAALNLNEQERSQRKRPGTYKVTDSKIKGLPEIINEHTNNAQLQVTGNGTVAVEDLVLDASTGSSLLEMQRQSSDEPAGNLLPRARYLKLPAVGVMKPVTKDATTAEQQMRIKIQHESPRRTSCEKTVTYKFKIKRDEQSKNSDRDNNQTLFRRDIGDEKVPIEGDQIVQLLKAKSYRRTMNQQHLDVVQRHQYQQQAADRSDIHSYLPVHSSPHYVSHQKLSNMESISSNYKKLSYNTYNEKSNHHDYIQAADKRHALAHKLQNTGDHSQWTMTKPIAEKNYASRFPLLPPINRCS